MIMKKNLVLIAFAVMCVLSGCTVTDKPPESEGLIPAVSDMNVTGDSTTAVTESTEKTANTSDGQSAASSSSTTPSAQVTTHTTASSPAGTAASPAAEVSGESARVVELCNIERAKAGLPPLKSDNSQLQQAADLRAAELHVSFSHTRPNGSSCFTAVKEFGVNYTSVGENVALGQKTPEQVMESLMNSEGHRGNIMSDSFTTIAVGYNNGAWAQLFIG